MVPVFTLERKDIDLLMANLRKSISYFKRARAGGNPHIRQNMIDGYQRVYNRLSKALDKHRWKTEKMVSLSQDR